MTWLDRASCMPNQPVPAAKAFIIQQIPDGAKPALSCPAGHFLFAGSYAAGAPPADRPSVNVRYTRPPSLTAPNACPINSPWPPKESTSTKSQKFSAREAPSRTLQAEPILSATLRSDQIKPTVQACHIRLLGMPAHCTDNRSVQLHARKS